MLGIASCMETMGHMPMFTQKLSEIFCFFNLDQISDVCNFGVSIGFVPLIRIVWIKNVCSEGLKKICAHLMKLCHKMCNFQISKISFVHACQCCWVSLWQPIFEIVTWMWHKLLDKTSLWAFKPYKSYILTSWLCQALQVAQKRWVKCLCLLKN